MPHSIHAHRYCNAMNREYSVVGRRQVAVNPALSPLLLALLDACDREGTKFALQASTNMQGLEHQINVIKET